MVVDICVWQECWVRNLDANGADGVRLRWLADHELNVPDGEGDPGRRREQGLRVVYRGVPGVAACRRNRAGELPSI